MTGKKIGKAFIYIILILTSLCMVFPFIWMILSSFKTPVEIIQFPPKFLPSGISFVNYAKAFEMAPFGRYFLNSILVMICSVVFTTGASVLCAFAFSRLHFPGREMIFSVLLSMMMVPFEMLIITNYTTVVKLHLYNTLPALFLPFVANIFYVYILKNFFDTVSDSLYYSARIDGASNWMYLWKILVPLAKPSLFTIILLNALSSWNSFVWPMYVTSDFHSRTLPYGLQVFTTEGGSFPELLMAASTVIILPMIVLFIIARKYIINGVSRGGLKG
ncbi:MAG: carbohydrate ABC transporter permease [Treponema sp.]|nr:carbohydrate ABC transporter permease [Treponema sp.]